jgi:protein required for attachment to host cells
MDATWIVSANAGRAKFFVQAGLAAPLDEVHELTNHAARLRTAETESDTLGQISASKSRHSVGAATQPSGYEPEQSPAEHQTELFARRVADTLLKAHYAGCYNKLCLVASPEFLGVLRKVMDSNLQSLIVSEINKDYTQLSPRDLRTRVRDHSLKH